MSNEKGMCPAMGDKEFFVLMTKNGTEYVDLTLQFYPELAQYVKTIEEDVGS